MNVPITVALALSSDKSLILPLSSSIGLEGLHDILEVVAVDSHNSRIVDKWLKANG